MTLLLTVKCELCIQVEVMICAVSVLMSVVAVTFSKFPHISCGVSHTNSVHYHRNFAIVFLKHQHDIFVDICSGSAAMEHLKVQTCRFHIPIVGHVVSGDCGVGYIIWSRPVIKRPSKPFSCQILLYCIFSILSQLHDLLADFIPVNINNL